MKRLKAACFLSFALIYFNICAQNVKDSCISIPLTGLHFSGQISMGDLSQRFGNSLNAGIPFYYKTKSNWLLGGEFNYFFGPKVKEQVLTNLLNEEGTVTANDGAPGRLRLNERGINIYASVGKILPFWQKNKNCGPFVSLGIGYMQHKVNIYDLGKNLPQLRGDLEKGYDRLTGGFAVTQFIGYLYLSENRLANFYAGFECNQGFTNGLRGFQYDTKSSDNQKRLDAQVGLRVGWVLPLYKRIKDVYYN